MLEILGPYSGQAVFANKVQIKPKNKPKWTIGLRKGENMAHKTIEMYMSSAQTNIISESDCPQIKNFHIQIKLWSMFVLKPACDPIISRS